MANVARRIAEEFETPITNFIENGVQFISDAVAGPFALAATLYIVIFGLMVTMGYVRSPLFDFIVNAFKLTFIVFLLKGADGYSEFVTKIFFEGAPNGIGAALVAAGGGGVSPTSLQSGAPFDQLINEGTNLMIEINKASGSLDVGQKVFAFAVMIVIGAAAVLMFAVVIYAKIALALIIAIGPIFIALALFNATRSFTSSWVSALVNFTVLQILIYAFLSLLVSFLQSYVSDPGGGADAVAKGISITSLMVLAIYITSQLPGVASALAGSGFAIGQGMIGKLAGTASAGVRGSMQASGAAARGGQWVANRVASIRSNTVSKR